MSGNGATNCNDAHGLEMEGSAERGLHDGHRYSQAPVQVRAAVGTLAVSANVENKMKMNDLGRVITGIAEIGAIAGIVLLAYEVHQNNEILETQASLARLQNRVAANNLFATDSDLAAAIIKDQAGDTLSSLEAFKVESHFSATLAKWEWEYQQYVSKVDPDLPVEDWRAVFRIYPAMRRMWADNAFKRRFSPPFVQFMDREIAVP